MCDINKVSSELECLLLKDIQYVLAFLMSQYCLKIHKETVGNVRTN